MNALRSTSSLAGAIVLFLSTSAAYASDSSAVLGLDSPWRCDAGNPRTNPADKTQGQASMQFTTPGYGLCTSPLIRCEDLDITGEELLFDIKLPTNLSNPWWVGDLSLYVEVPSANVFNAWVGRTELTGLPVGQWVTVNIPATPTMLAALSGNCGDATLKFALNTSATGVSIDNIRFSGDVTPVEPVEMQLTVTDDADDGQFDPSTSVIPAGWSVKGERSNLLYMGSYNIAEWGGLGGGLTPSVFRFTLSHDIPAGATITSAALSLYGLDVWDWDNTTDALSIALEFSDDAAPITSSADMPLAVGGRDLLTATARWPESGGLVWQHPGWNTSPNLAALLQELVDTLGGLNAGAHVQLYVYGAVSNVNSEVAVEDSSHSGDHAATLTIVAE